MPRPVGLLGRLWSPRRDRIESENEARRRQWSEALAAWNQAHREHEAGEAHRRHDHEVGRHSDLEAMERVLAARLAEVGWPRETQVSLQVRDDGRRLELDVDLPEVEEMPREQAAPAARGLRLLVRSKSDTQVRREYKRHVHGVLFRVIGEAFHVLPGVEQVVASGYSQRPDPATGRVRDDYLISVRVARDDWAGLSFDSLEALDLVTAFERFDVRRNMTRTGIFRPIEPHVGAE